MKKGRLNFVISQADCLGPGVLSSAGSRKDRGELWHCLGWERASPALPALQLFTKARARSLSVLQGTGEPARMPDTAMRHYMSWAIHPHRKTWLSYLDMLSFHLLPQAPDKTIWTNLPRKEQRYSSREDECVLNLHHFVCPFTFLVVGIRWTKTLFHKHNVGLRKF